MTISNQSTVTIPESLFQVSETMLQLLRSFNAQDLNTIPFEGSWTAAQLADHMIKSNSSMAKAMEWKGQASKRRPDERVESLKGIFLDFAKQLKSPDFILPEKQVYEPEVVAALENSYDLLRERASRTELSDSVDHPIFGEITKLELLYFVEFHTQRHTHQLQKIRDHIK